MHPLFILTITTLLALAAIEILIWIQEHRVYGRLIASVEEALRQSKTEVPNGF